MTEENKSGESASASSSSHKPLFPRLDASETALESDNAGITEIESACMNCYKTGTTKLLLTRIPFYRDVIISSFSCEHCNYQNNGIESANKIQERGVRYKLLVANEKDLNREVVKSDNGTFQIPLIDFEIPPRTQKGTLTTIEGIIDRVKSNLEMDIETKKEADEELAKRLEQFIKKLDDLKSFKLGPFEIVLDDPSGDSFIENPFEPKKDPNMSLVFYKRTPEQNEELGLNPDEEEEEEEKQAEEDIKNEVVQFHGNCPNCNAPCQTNMKMTDIPYFKTVIIMCTVCDTCGSKSSEVKSGTGIEEKGVKYSLKLTDPTDVNRDLLKGDDATFEIPEIDFFVNSGTLGGKFTTIEGLLKDFREQLDQVKPFAATGDSQTREKSNRMRDCLQNLERIQNGQMLDVTIILDDPSGNSYLQNVYAPEDDPNLKIEHYERSFDQNEQLGLNDMKVDNYKSNDDN